MRKLYHEHLFSVPINKYIYKSLVNMAYLSTPKSLKW